RELARGHGARAQGLRRDARRGPQPAAPQPGRRLSRAPREADSLDRDHRRGDQQGAAPFRARGAGDRRARALPRLRRRLFHLPRGRHRDPQQRALDVLGCGGLRRRDRDHRGPALHDLHRARRRARGVERGGSHLRLGGRRDARRAAAGRPAGRRHDLHQERRRLHHRVREQLQRLPAAGSSDRRRLGRHRLADEDARRRPRARRLVAQDFWASSGFALLERSASGLRPTEAWLARFLAREELAPPAEAGAQERALHAKLARDPRAPVAAAEVERVEDADARDNWRAFLRFRDHLWAHATLEDGYRSLFGAGAVDLAPPFVDALVQAITRSMLEGTADAWLCRAAEMLFRRQRLAAEDGRILAADAATVETYAETGGFGAVGKLLRSQGTSTAAVKMDVLTHENAPFYFLRDELYSFVLDLTAGSGGAAALARVLERWIAHLAGVAVTIEPASRVEDARWRWHVGLDLDSTSILN